MIGRKITEAHRRRRAVVYVRQSTLGAGRAQHRVGGAPVRAARARGRARAGRRESVAVVDEDTGRSGASSDGRLGFKELVAEVGLGQVGLVAGAGGLAAGALVGGLAPAAGPVRADRDADRRRRRRLLAGGLQRPAAAGPEGHDVGGRAASDPRAAGRRAAQQGRSAASCASHLPVGLDRDDDDRIVLCPDEQVRHAIERVFVLWRRLGSARQVVVELIAEGQKLPRRTVGQRRIRWARASYGAVHDFLTNPGLCGRVRVRSHAPGEAPRTPTGDVKVTTSRCRSRSGLSACPSTIPAMCPGTSTSPRASGCART